MPSKLCTLNEIRSMSFGANFLSRCSNWQKKDHVHLSVNPDRAYLWLQKSSAFKIMLEICHIYDKSSLKHHLNLLFCKCCDGVSSNEPSSLYCKSIWSGKCTAYTLPHCPPHQNMAIPGSSVAVFSCSRLRQQQLILQYLQL